MSDLPESQVAESSPAMVPTIAPEKSRKRARSLAASNSEVGKAVWSVRRP